MAMTPCHTLRRRGRAPIAAALLALTLLAGCSGSGSGSEAGIGSSGGGVTEPDATAADTELLAALAMTAEDAAESGDGGSVGTIPGADDIAYAGNTSYCAILRTTDSDLEARANRQLRDAEGRYLADNEAALYAPGAAAKTMNEIKGAFIDCPEGELVDPPGGAPPAVYEAVPITEDRLTDLASDHVAATVTVTPEKMQVSTRTIIYQRRGDVIIATFSEDEDLAVELANAAGKRLAAADASAVGD